jgi:hypothetical protein
MNEDGIFKQLLNVNMAGGYFDVGGEVVEKELRQQTVG